MVDSEDIEVDAPRSPLSLLDSPGVFVQQTNLGGGSPIMRGFVGPQVLLHGPGSVLFTLAPPLDP